MLKLTKCHKCKYYVEPTEYDLMPKCKAFPEGIPLERAAVSTVNN